MQQTVFPRKAQSIPGQPLEGLDKFGLAMQHLMGLNDRYFKERGKVCCSNKPPRERVSYPHMPGQSTYHEDYPPKQA